MNSGINSLNVRKASFLQALSTLEPDLAPALLFDFNAEYAVGAIKIAIADGFWERHQGGDEILIVLQGKMEFTLRSGDVDETVWVEAGDILHIPQGIAHGAKVHETVHLLFFTPKAQNQAWTEEGVTNDKAIARHA